MLPGIPFRAFGPNVDRMVRRSTIVNTADDVSRCITEAIIDKRPLDLELGSNITVKRGFIVSEKLLALTINGAQKFKFVLAKDMPYLFWLQGREDPTEEGGQPFDLGNTTIELNKNVTVSTLFLVDQTPLPAFQLKRIGMTLSRVQVSAQAGNLDSVFGLTQDPSVGFKAGSVDVDGLEVDGAAKLFRDDGPDAQWHASTFQNVTLFGKGVRLQVGSGAAGPSFRNCLFSKIIGDFDVNTGSLSDNNVWQVLKSGLIGATFQTNGGPNVAQTLMRVDDFSVKVLSPGDINLDVDTDVWTTVSAPATFTSNVTTAADIPGLAFTPEANKNYEVEALLLIRSTATTTGVRIGWNPPTGLNDGGVNIDVPVSAASRTFSNAGGAASQANGTSMPVVNVSYLSTVKGFLRVGPTPSGDFTLTLSSEVAASDVSVRAGSILRFREI